MGVRPTRIQTEIWWHKMANFRGCPTLKLRIMEFIKAFVNKSVRILVGPTQEVENCPVCPYRAPGNLDCSLLHLATAAHLLISPSSRKW
ncbi:MAG: hypothetical protein ACFFD2_19905 [Promethearchaeota archaeon]